MTWSITNLVIQIIGGIFGGHAAAVAVKDHDFGAFGHTLAGAVGGVLSGCLLQTLAATMVTGTGTVNEPRFAELAMLQGLTGAVAGGIAMLLFGFLKHSIEQHKSTKS
jgi:uncharacterized membrane protein YeaQ/YmgE (transglycosylase-associated protein family)